MPKQFMLGWGPNAIHDDVGLRCFIACYYRDGRSLCGRFTHQGAAPMLSEAIHPEDGPCVDCLTELQAEQRQAQERNPQVREDTEAANLNIALDRFLDKRPR